MPPRSGLQQLNTILSTLAGLPTGEEPTSFLRAVRYLESRHRKRCLVIFLTDFTDELSAREMYSTLSALTKRHVMIFVGVSDPHLEEIFDSPNKSTASLFEKAVAGQLMLERRRTLETGGFLSCR